MSSMKLTYSGLRKEVKALSMKNEKLKAIAETMTIEELKAIVEAAGYKLVKKPEYNCTCCVARERRLQPSDFYYLKRCKEAYFVETTKRGYTHCIKETKK